MSTRIPGFQSFFRLFASFYIDQISHQQHKGLKTGGISVVYPFLGEKQSPLDVFTILTSCL